MRRKKSTSGPNNSYLISFGDTMTALLAFFIVLNSLASEQTGVNLYSGTGSFIRATDELGVPGIFAEKLSRSPMQLDHTPPVYIVPDPSSDQSGSGPDEESDSLYIRDWEQQELDRVLIELERFHDHAGVEETDLGVAFDRMNPLPQTGSLIDEEMRKMLVEIAPFARRNDSMLKIVVWTPSPGPTVWARSTEQAARLASVISDQLQLSPQKQSKIHAVSQLWPYSDIKRPSMTIVATRLR
ncbi:flagellar motor protein MotB [Thalassoglobus sp. JC818]|uniref:flagellar motor protein MotB n=1 Tax=Thalassoglobus sp. JC818 TaxID=3232136 RepID=UPI00345A1DFD